MLKMLITEEQARTNQEIINRLMEALGIDNIEQIKDFSIHVKQPSNIEIEIHAYNKELKIEKITKIFNSAGKAIDRMKPEFVKDLYSKWRTIEPGKVYNNVYVGEGDFTYQKEGIVIECSGRIISDTPTLTELGENDLILKDLKGIKKIEPNYPPRPGIMFARDRIIPNVPKDERMKLDEGNE